MYFLPLTLVQFTIVVLSIFFLMGTLLFCRIPYLARGTGINASDVAIRCLDWHQAEPFYLIEGYESHGGKAAAAWPDVPIAKVETTAQPGGGFRHHVLPVTGEPAHVDSTTPHTRLTRAQIDEARAGLQTLYSPADRLTWARALSWGEGLMMRWWERSFQKEHSGRDAPIIEPRGGTEEEQIWFAWRRLRAGMPEDSDLADLGTLARKTYPNAGDYEAALAWARAFHECRERYYRQWLTLRRGQTRSMAFHGETCMPPLVDSTLWWILYQHVGLDDASRAAARTRWLRFFPGKEAETLAWGRSLEAARRGAGEPLPPTSDNVALLCVIERLTGWDDYGVLSRRLALDALDPFPGGTFGTADTFMNLTISVGYPSDDIFLLLASGDPLGIGVLEEWDMDRSTPLHYFGWLVAWFAMLAILLLVLRFMVLDTLGGSMLFMRGHDRFRRYFNSQTQANRTSLALGLVLVPLLKWAWEWWNLKPPADLLMTSPWRLLAGVYMSVLFGGLIILIINRTLAVVLLRLGYDIERTWMDEILGTSLGVALLWYFGNSWASLLAFAAAGVLPDALKRLWKRRYAPPPVHAPVTLTPAAARAARVWLKQEPRRPYLRVFDDGAAHLLDLDSRFDPARDLLFEPAGVPVLVFQHQADFLRGIVIDHDGGRFVIHPPGTSPHPADEDATVHDPEPLILEIYPTARWTGITLGLGFMGLTAFGMACTKRDEQPRTVHGAPATLRLVYPANVGWLPTGITLDPEMIVHVSATGTIEAAPPGDPRADYHAVPPAGRAPQNHFPEPRLPALALLGKVGTVPFLLGERQAFRVNDKGAKLLLGINDDDPTDNAGQWLVEIIVYNEKP
jgi:Fe-S cluster assembly iron-binding protein IscA